MIVIYKGQKSKTIANTLISVAILKAIELCDLKSCYRNYSI